MGDTRDFSILRDGMTFKVLIDALNDELRDDAIMRTERRDETFSVRLAVRLVDHVEEVRREVREERKEARENEEKERRERQREMREKAKQANLAALGQLDEDDA